MITDAINGQQANAESHQQRTAMMLEPALLHELLKPTNLVPMDACRLVLEAWEAMTAELQGQPQAKQIQILREALREGVAALRKRTHTVSLEQAAAASLAARQHRRPTTIRDLRHYIRRMLRVEDYATQPLRAFNVTQCRRLLQQSCGSSAHSFRKGRMILHSIFAYGLKHEWCENNPVDAIDAPSPSERPILPLSLAECRRLLQTAQTPAFQDCLPPLALMMLAGVRPAEVTRLSWQDIAWEEGVLVIAPRHSKTGGGRHVDLCPALRRLLKAYGGSKDSSICPPHWEQRWPALRRAAGFRRWVPDVLRHTFATYHLKMHHDLAALQVCMGHRDASLLRTRYVNLQHVSRREAAAFWALA